MAAANASPAASAGGAASLEDGPPAAGLADASHGAEASAVTAAEGSGRIELARAYLDLGDLDTARELLHEVVRAGDPEARLEANRLLEGIA